MALAKWIPDRKVLAGGITGLVAFFASQALGLDVETSTGIAGMLWTLVQYFIPPSAGDIINKVDAAIRKAGIDPGTPVGELAKK